MITLQEKQPKSYQYLQDGGFVVRRSSRRFSAIASDQALEQTVNRDGKSQGGVIGFTLRKGALTRWMVTRHITEQYTEAFKELCHSNKEAKITNHSEHGQTTMARYERDVVKIEEYVRSTQNPYDLETVPDELVNVTTGQVASREVSDGLSNFMEAVEKRNITFIEKQLLVDRTVSFWDTDPRTKTPTFANMSKTLTSTKSDKIMVDSEVLFRRLLAVSKHRDVSLEEVLTHELAPVLPSLFNDDGTMRKTSKADLAKKLESNCDEIQVLGDSDEHDIACIIDGMALLQGLDERFDTFDDLGSVVMHRITSLLDGNLGVTSVTVVFNRYDSKVSIKQLERDRRAGGEKTPTYRQWKPYSTKLQKILDKLLLQISTGIYLTCVYLTQTASLILKEQQSITLAVGFDDGQVVKVLDCTGVHLKPENCKVYMNAGHCGKSTNRQRYIPVNTITDKLGKDVALCLPASHAVSGCDTTSSLYKIGKRTAYNKLLLHIGDLLPLTQLGQCSDVSNALPTATKYVLLMYGSKSQSCQSLNQLCYYACKSDKAASLFPPTDDAFKQHMRCVNYQVAIWGSHP